MELFFMHRLCSVLVQYHQCSAFQWAPWDFCYRSVSVFLRRYQNPFLLNSPPSIDIDDFDKALESVFTGKATILNRMRLACTFYNKDLEKKTKDGDGQQILTIFPSYF